MRALTSGKAPLAKTIISDVFPQPPSPTRTTLTERPLCGASSPAAWDAFIPGWRTAVRGQQAVHRGLAAAGTGLARRDRNVEGAGRREEVGAGRSGQKADSGGGGHPAQVRSLGQDGGAAPGQGWTLLGSGLPASCLGTQERLLQHLLRVVTEAAGVGGDLRLQRDPRARGREVDKYLKRGWGQGRRKHLDYLLWVAGDFYE